VAVLSPGTAGSEPRTAMTKFARWWIGSYQPASASQCRTAVPWAVIVPTSTLPPLVTVVELACQ
jgi:hypothetical protein